MSDEPTYSQPWAQGPPHAGTGYWTSEHRPVPGRPLVEPLPAVSAARVLLAAVLAGFAAQLLFAFERPGLNVPLWVAIVLLAAWLLRRPGLRMDRADVWLAPTALAFAAFVALRDEMALRVFDLPVAGSLTLAAAVAFGGNAVSRRSWTGLAWLAALATAVFFSGATRLVGGFGPLGRSVSRDARLTRVLRGVALAVPLVIVFVALFSAADAVFSAYVQATVGIELNPPEIFYRLGFALLAGWLFAGAVVCAWLARPVAQTTETPETGERKAAAGTGAWASSVESVIVLLALDLVFGLFVLLQAAYLFGGADTLAVSGMTYSEYARRGFFELILVALLAGGVILATDRLTAQRGWAYRSVAIILSLLTGMVLVSALVRLGLYQQAYGWTELRFYALTAIGWLAAGIVATVGALALDRVSAVPRVLLGTGLAVALLVNIVGPQAFVAAQNVERAIDPSLVAPGGHSGLDLHYISHLGGDSVPVLVQSMARLPEAEREAADRLLRARAGTIVEQSAELGWPSWNLARQRAIESLTNAGYLVLVER